MKQNIREIFNQLVENFNFDKVHEVCKIDDYFSWINCSQNPIDEMKRCVHELFNDCIYNMIENNINSSVCSSGGFEVSVERYKINKEYHFNIAINFIAVNDEIDTVESF